jgi:hypothetical protein
MSNTKDEKNEKDDTKDWKDLGRSLQVTLQTRTPRKIFPNLEAKFGIPGFIDPSGYWQFISAQQKLVPTNSSTPKDIVRNYRKVAADLCTIDDAEILVEAINRYCDIVGHIEAGK